MLTFSLSSIQDLDSVTQKLSLVGSLFVTWKDEFLTWNKTEFGGVDAIIVYQNEVWRPALSLGWPLDTLSEVGLPTTPVKIKDNGHVSWIPKDVFTFKCSVNTRFYPMDTQVCYLEFETARYQKNEVYFVSNHDKVILDTFEDNVEWELFSATSFVQSRKYEQFFKNALTLRRRSQFIILHSLAPVLLLSILNILVFVLPAESGEKISLSITMFLAFAIFLTVLSDSLPNNSLTLPIFSVYLIIVNIFSTLYVVLTVFVLKVYHKPTNAPVPAFLQRFHKLCSRSWVPVHSIKVAPKDDEVTADSVWKKEAGKENILTDNKINNQDLDQIITWIDVSRALDRAFAWIFSLLLVLTTCIFVVVLTVWS